MDAKNFNADISRWNLLKVLDIGTTPSTIEKGDRRNGLKSMFKGAWYFNQDLCSPGWNAVRDRASVGKQDQFAYTGESEYDVTKWSGFKCCDGGSFYDRGLEWTFNIEIQTIDDDNGMYWKRGTVVKQNIWTLTIMAQEITAAAGVTVTQGSGTDKNIGTLQTALTGAGTLKVVITSKFDVPFLDYVDVVIGTVTTVPHSNIILAEQAQGILKNNIGGYRKTDDITSFVVLTRYDVTLVATADIIIGEKGSTMFGTSRVDGNGEKGGNDNDASKNKNNAGRGYPAVVLSATGVSLRGTPVRGECETCPVGQYQDKYEVIPEQCTPCERNYFTSPAGGALKCTACLTGAFCESGATSCTMCPVGQHIITDSSTNFPTGCAKCIAGTFQSKQGQNTCEACPKGYQQNEKEGIFCLPCGPGKTQHEEGKTNCIDCSVGLFMATLGSTTSDCTDCTKGQFNNEVGQSGCKSCPAGTWSETLKLDDESKCTKCIAGRYSKAKGADKEDTCIDCKFYVNYCIMSLSNFITISKRSNQTNTL